MLFGALGDIWEVCGEAFGLWEGLSWDEIERQYKTDFHRWMNHWKTIAPPQGESLPRFQKRVATWYNELDPHFVHILIGHAGVWRAIHVHSQLQTWDDAMSMAIPHLELIPLIYPNT